MRKKFIDLFAGLGGFHQALEKLGHECVFACEINEELAKIYEINFGIIPHRDIRNLNISNVPDHDILCAGFPCQPFSKAGGQKGFECPQWGDLFDYVIKILKKCQPEFIIIENVPNLIYHDNGKTWKSINNKLKNIGYDVTDNKLSPHMFGIPQIRERAFIVGKRHSLNGFAWPATNPTIQTSITSILDSTPPEAKRLTSNHLQYLKAWGNFVKNFPKNIELPSFPIWAMEFGATYPYEEVTPLAYGLHNLHRFAGSFGKPLKGLPQEEKIQALPAYARDSAKNFPKWKVDFIKQNREFYLTHKQFIDDWIPQILPFAASFQKFEWNCKGEDRDLWKFVIQFRASGIRVKRTSHAPSLVAMTSSQVPVITWEKRYMTIKECSRLQSMGDLRYLPETQTAAFKALGNAVNVAEYHRWHRDLGVHLRPTGSRECEYGSTRNVDLHVQCQFALNADDVSAVWHGDLRV